jgi:hypothetical protein
MPDLQKQPLPGVDPFVAKSAAGSHYDKTTPSDAKDVSALVRGKRCRSLMAKRMRAAQSGYAKGVTGPSHNYDKSVPSAHAASHAPCHCFKLLTRAPRPWVGRRCVRQGRHGRRRSGTSVRSRFP